MGKVYAIGEIVYDIIFKNGQPCRANIGGSVLNASVSLGRVNVPVGFVGETGNDVIGTEVLNFLQSNSIDTSYIQVYNENKSTIALAFLNENNDASYSFYKDYPTRRLTGTLPEPHKKDILLFGSSFALHHDVRKALLNILHKARENGALVIYDPNIRKQTEELNELLPLIKENISLSDIVRGSDEDFFHILNSRNEDEIFSFVENSGCKSLIITKNKHNVFVKSFDYSENFGVPEIIPVSTIGAGDNFNAGIIASLYNQEINKDSIETLNSAQWEKIISTGISFSSNVCCSLDNYISKSFANNFKR